MAAYLEIEKVIGREILDSRGNPTVEAEVYLADGTVGRGAAPSGASTGEFEALELRDKDKSRYLGKGVTKAVENINTVINDCLFGIDASDIYAVDAAMIKADGTKDKSNLGANAILAVSIAAARAASVSLDIPLYRFLGGVSGNRLPVPMMNIINGGCHALSSGLDVQEFMIMPVGAKTFREAMRIASEVYQSLKSLITKRYGSDSVNVGDEGGFAPNITNEDGHNAIHPAMNSVNTALDLICEAIAVSGYSDVVRIGMDVAASEFYDTKYEKYDLMKKARKNEEPRPEDLVSSAELLRIYEDLVSRYPIISIEDGFNQDDFEGWSAMTRCLGDSRS